MHYSIPFKPHPLLVLLTMTATGSLWANPQLPQVVHGQVTMAQAGKVLTVTNSPGAIINWQQFNIDRGELTRFVQQNAASQVLNRVVGGDPSRILGSLQSNGRVFLVNPNGIVFGAGSQVDVAGLVASTLRLSNEDFLNNRLRFTDTPGAAGIGNAGHIRSTRGGEVLLIAPQVENSGLIQAPDGNILLAAGRSVEVADIDRPNIRVEIRNTDEQAVNLGSLLARHISIYGGLVKNSGRIQADSAVMGENGKIILKAAQRVVLEPSSVVTATGSQGSIGGDISITAHNTQGLAGGGEVLVQGVVSAQPQAQVAAAAWIENVIQNKPVAPLNKAQEAIRNIAKETPNPAAATMPSAAAEPSAPMETLADGANGLDAASHAALAGVAVGSAVGLMAKTTSSTRTPPAIPSTPTPARPAPSTPALPVNPVAPASPAGGTGTGGSIRISAGGRVMVGEGARLDASGDWGGGEILVGGGWQGLNPNIINSQFTYIASTATLYANANLRGNGGLVVVWANDSARIYGQIAARGGALGGDGGYIETSGKRMLDVTRVADASAVAGKGGQWLLDPNNVTVEATGTETNVTGNPNFATTADSATITVATIQAALNAGINVTITTSAGGAQLGDISLNSAISTSSSTDVTLTLVAHNNINLNADISATGAGKFNLVINADADASGAGVATLSGAKVMLNGGVISSGNQSVLTITGLATLSNARLALDAVVSGTAYMAGGLTLVNNILTLNGSLLYHGSQTLGGTGQIVLAAAGSSLYRGSGSNTTLTIGSGITLSSTSSSTVYLGYYGDEIIAFAGTLNANNPNTNWQLSGMVNTGVINLSEGTLNFDSSSSMATWHNSSLAGKGIFVNGGTLNLGGSFKPSDLGNFSRTSGTVNITGEMDLQGGTLDVGNAGIFKTGGLSSLNFGVLKNGTLISGDGTVFNSNGGTLDGMTIGSNLSFGAGSTTASTSTFIAHHLKLANGITVDKGAGSWFWSTTGAQELTTVSGTATIHSTGGYLIYGYDANQTITIGAGITVNGIFNVYGYGSGSVINNGTLVASGTGASSSILAFAFTNNGSIRTSGASYLNLYSYGTGSTGGMFTNAGTITVAAEGTVILGSSNFSSAGSGLDVQSGGTLTFNGGNYNFTSSLAVVTGATVNLESGVNKAHLEGLSFQGGTAVLNSTYDNTGNTVNLSGTGGQLRLGYNGQIIGGTVSSSRGVGLSSIGGILDGVTLATNMTVEDGSGLILLNGLTLSGGAKLILESSGALSYVLIKGSGVQTIGGTGSIEFTGTGQGNLRSLHPYLDTGVSLALGSGITVNANAGGSFWDTTQTWSMDGSFNVNASVDTVYTNLSNRSGGAASEVNVLAGTLHINHAGGTPIARLRVDAGAMVESNATAATTLGAGFIVSGTGRLINVSSYGVTVDGMASNGLTFVSESGSGGITFARAISIGGLEVRGGAVNGAGAVNVSGNLILSDGSLALTGGITLGGAGSVWSGGSIDAGTVINNGTLTIQGHGNQSLQNAGTKLVNAGTLIYDNTDGNFVVKNAAIENKAGALIDVRAGTLKAGTLFGNTNNGEIRTALGTLLVHTGVLTNKGTISGLGTLDLGGSTLTNLGTLAPGHGADATGLLRIIGNLVMGAGSIYQVQLGSSPAVAVDTLAVSGDVTYGGTLSVSGTPRASFMKLLTSGSRTAGSVFATLNISSPGLTPAYGGEGMTLSFYTSGVWTGAGDGVNWSNPDNWGTGMLPGVDDFVNISTGTGNLVMSSGSYSIKGLDSTRGLTVKTGASLSLLQDSTVAGLDLQGDVKIGSGATLTTLGGFTWTGLGASSLSGAGTFLVATGQSATISGSAHVLDTTLTIASGASLDLGANTSLGGSGSLLNNGKLTARSLSWGGDFTNALGGVASLSGTLSGDFSNAGTLNVDGFLTLKGANAEHLSGVINLNNTSELWRETAGFSWWSGAIRGTGGFLYRNGGSLLYAGAGQREINTPNLTYVFANQALPLGSLTVRSGTVQLDGSNTLSQGASWTLDGGDLVNNGPLSIAGSLSLLSGHFSGSGTLSTTNTGSFSVPAGSSVVWSATGALSNLGSMSFSDQTFGMAMNNQGSMQLGSGLVFAQLVTNSGTLVALSGSNTQFQGGLTLNGGSLQLSNGDITGNVTLHAGSISGTGNLFGNLVVGSATLAPGFSPGALTIAGNLTLSANSVLNLELGGMVPGSGYDVIKVNGVAALNGSLHVSSYGGFTPAAGSTFTVMKFASATGAFTHTTPPAGWTMLFVPGVSSYGLTAVSVTPTQPTPPPTVFKPASSVVWNDVVAEVSQPKPLEVLLARADQTGTMLDATPTPEQKLVSVEKVMEEEACQ